MTGASGFLGRSVLPELLRRGHHPVALTRSRVAAQTVTSLGAEVTWGDLDDPASLDAAFCGSGADSLANLASLGFGHAPAVIAAAEEAGITRAVFISTTAIFTSLPARSLATRTSAEATIQSAQLHWTILRPTMIYGRPGDRNMHRLLRFVRRSPLVPLPGGGHRLIQPVHVDDIAGFVALALEREDTVGQSYTLAGPEALSLREVVEAAGRATDRRPLLVTVPLRPAITAVRIYEKTTRNPRLKVEQLLRLNEDKAFAIDPAREVGFAPRSFADGIAAEASLLR